MNVLDLFSGIGGFSLGLERAGMTTVAFCENEPFCQQVLQKHWPDVPIFDDVRTLTKRKLDERGIGTVDLVCGGYPCQPFSTAGKRRGKADDRHLWPEMHRLVQELRPTWVIGENVAGHISMGLDEVLSDLAMEGYTARTFVIPACAVDASHRRDRVWTVAYDDRITNARHNGGMRGQGAVEGAEPSAEALRGALANAHDSNAQRQQFRGDDPQIWCEPLDGSSRLRGRTRHDRQWPPEPAVGRVAHGVPRRMDRLRALGNAVVPQIPEEIGRAIMSIHNGSSHA